MVSVGNLFSILYIEYYYTVCRVVRMCSNLNFNQMVRSKVLSQISLEKQYSHNLLYLKNIFFLFFLVKRKSILIQIYRQGISIYS